MADNWSSLDIYGLVMFQEEQEEEEEVEEVYVPYAPPVPKPWQSFGSEVEIDEETVVESRKKVRDIRCHSCL